MLAKLSSRKLWVTVTGMLAVLFGGEATGIDFTGVQIAALAVVAAAYVLAEAAVDFARAFAQFFVALYETLFEEVEVGDTETSTPDTPSNVTQFPPPA